MYLIYRGKHGIIPNLTIYNQKLGFVRVRLLTDIDVHTNPLVNLLF